MKTYFIVGTDTDCGKTYVSSELLRVWQDKHYTALGLKPVASGCIEENGQLISEDAIQLMHYNTSLMMSENPAANQWCDLAKDANWYRYKEPISPHLAAEIANKPISLTKLMAECQNEAFLGLDYLLIEGAGGLNVPLNEKETWVDFLQQMNLSVILVVGMRLGCINHALLTQLALDYHQIHCAGWIANCLDANMLSLNANIDTLSKKITAPLLGVIPYGGAISSELSI